MANTPFPMPHTAQLFKKSGAPTRERSGQVTTATEFAATAVSLLNCLFYGYTGGKSTNGRTDFDQVVAFYLPPGVDIDEGDKIEDIQGRDFFEHGPFEVLNVRYVTSLTGKVHHISCKMKGIVG